MSENYQINKKEDTMLFDVLAMVVAFIFLFPLLPLNIVYVFLILKTRKKENYVIYVCVVIVVILISKVHVLFEETAHIIAMLIKGFVNYKIVISAYGYYSWSSWVLLVAISFVIASCLVKRIRHNRKLEEVGVNSLLRKYRKNGGKRYAYSY